MHFNGIVTINAPREKVWAFLIDPDSLTQCAPGLASLEVITPNEKFRAVASIGFGAVHGTAPGSVMDTTSEMHLSDGTNGATELNWSSDVTIVSMIASLAARLMGVVAQKMSETFFYCVRKIIEGC